MRRLVGAGLLLSVAFYFVAAPALDLVRLDPIVQSDAVGCTYVDGVQCPIVEARQVLESFGLLDEARGLWRPLLILTHNLPAIVLTLIAVGLAAPWKLANNARALVVAGVILVAVTAVLPQVMYARTIDAVTVITD